MERIMSNQPEVPSDTRSLIEQSFGMWADRTDIGDNWLAEGRKLWRSSWHLENNELGLDNSMEHRSSGFTDC